MLPTLPIAPLLLSNFARQAQWKETQLKETSFAMFCHCLAAYQHVAGPRKNPPRSLVRWQRPTRWNCLQRFWKHPTFKWSRKGQAVRQPRMPHPHRRREPKNGIVQKTTAGFCEAVGPSESYRKSLAKSVWLLDKAIYLLYKYRVTLSVKIVWKEAVLHFLWKVAVLNLWIPAKPELPLVEVFRHIFRSFCNKNGHCHPGSRFLAWYVLILQQKSQNSMFWSLAKVVCTPMECIPWTEILDEVTSMFTGAWLQV